MKFTEKLSAHLTPEWRQQYISYADLKIMMLNALENAPIKEISFDRIVDNYYVNFEEEFFIECENELRKINTFFSEKLAEAQRRNEVLATALNEAMDDVRLRNRTMSRANLHKFSKLKRKKSRIVDLKNAFSELYLSLVLLQNYKLLNSTGFKKILKKHDKLFNNNRGKKWFEENVSTSYFYINNDVERLMDDVEYNFTEYLENGDRTVAMKRLRVPPLMEMQQIGTVFRVGLFQGAFIALLIFILLLSFSGNIEIETTIVHGLNLFRAPFYVVMYLFLLGINVFCWRRAGVNHILIFEINPRQHLTFSDLLELHAIFGLIWSLCVLGFIYAHQINMPPLIFPLLLICLMLAFLLNPFNIYHRSGRYWLLKLIGRIILAPLYPVGFADFWFGDQLNSLVHALMDFKYILCFYSRNYIWSEDFEFDQCLEKDYIGNAVVRCLPSWFRFAQCLRRYYDTGKVHPFLVNAGKYFSTFPMVIFSTLDTIYKENYDYKFQNPYVWCYIVTAIIKTLYCICWDLLYDFGLFQTFKGANIYLRDQIIYAPGFYYFVIIENILLRFFWAFSLYLVTFDYITSFNMLSFAGCFEIIRRYIWNYVRLENEHLFNVGQFRAVRDIFITPINVKNSVDIQQMMDSNDGVLNRLSSTISRTFKTIENKELQQN